MTYTKYISLSKYVIGAVRNKVSESKHSTSQKLLIQGNFIDESTSGIYSLVGGGSRVFHKISTVVEHEMKAIGAQKIVMPSLSHHKPWKTSGRWDEMGSELYKFTDRKGIEHCLSPTHEETVTSIVAKFSPVSEKHLPIKLYQTGRKFRDEMRPKGGLLRCKEFEMKDLYIFDKDIDSAQQSYHEVCSAYEKIFSNLELPYIRVEGSTGAMGGLLSDEYHVPASIGEDTLHTCDRCGKGFNEEMITTAKIQESCDKSDCPKELTKKYGIEIAHAFLLGTKYSSIFNATCTGTDNTKKPLVMGCFGIGISRLIAAVLEARSDTTMRWPTLIAPHQVCIVPQKDGYKSEVTSHLAEGLAMELSDLPHLSDEEVILDDRTNLSIGHRVKDAKLVGYPYVVALGKKALEDVPLYEMINVHTNESQYVTKSEVIETLANIKTTRGLR